MRYIDADALKNLILNDMAEAEREGKDLNGYTDALFHLKTIPTADVAEVRHGKWLHENNPNTDIYEHRPLSICSECGHTRIGDKPYCAECGAKMDGERRQDTE